MTEWFDYIEDRRRRESEDAKSIVVSRIWEIGHDQNNKNVIKHCCPDENNVQLMEENTYAVDAGEYAGHATKTWELTTSRGMILFIVNAQTKLVESNGKILKLSAKSSSNFTEHSKKERLNWRRCD